MKKVFFIITACLTVSIALASEPDGKTHFEKKCGNCHSLERSLRKNKSLEAWKQTAKRMLRYESREPNEKDVEIIASYLAGRNNIEKTVVPQAPSPTTAVPEEHEMFAFKKVRTSQFIEPAVCGDCHYEKYRQWSGSMHSKAFYDPLWRSATKFFFKEANESGEILEMKACVKCHTPLGFRSYAIASPADDYEKLAALPAQGIFCNWCHNINEVKHIGDAGYDVEPGGGEDDPSTMLGPLKDANSDFHPTKYSELHTKSEFCGLCHNVSHAGNNLPLEQTYTEWKNSPYNTGNPETTVNCQDCHMRQSPGFPATGKTKRPDYPGKAADNGPDRDHVWTHYFIGANALVTKLLGSDMHAQMAVERLQNAADLELIASAPLRKDDISRIFVKVTNSGAGHYLPTGLTEVRQMWLSVTIVDAKEKTIFKSGVLDKNGDLEKSAVIYYTRLGNAKGEPVENVAKADRILFDHRVPPKGYLIEKFAFQIPSDAVSPLTVKVTLRYRSASQALARILFEERAPAIPVIDMVSLDEKITF